MFIGIDGCRQGWIVAALDGGYLELDLVQNLSEIRRNFGTASRVLIDMPLGLLSRASASNGPYRKCDVVARKMLGKRWPTVFHPPWREALVARDHAEASRLNKESSGKGLSVQAWSLFKRIIEADEFMQLESLYRIYEFHPELAFLNLGGQGIPRKKTVAGAKQRTKILFEELREMPSARKTLEDLVTTEGSSPDDYLDAAVGAILARKSFECPRFHLIEPTERDDYNIEMNMVYLSSHRIAN